MPDAVEQHDFERYSREELKQLSEEGRDVSAFSERLPSVSDWERFYREVCAADLPMTHGFRYEEPSTLEEIRALRPGGPREVPVSPDEGALRDRILGGWLGRSAGCLLGKPVKGWSSGRIERLIEATDEGNLADYWPVIPDVAEEFDQFRRPNAMLRAHITGMVRDDDMDYPVLALKTLESVGIQVTPVDFARAWLQHLPYLYVYTAERVAYRNFINGLSPPDSATFQNPYREWIGAMIRADLLGWICPGRPELAAGLAFRDACISHVKNGIYGEMFIAAALAAAFAIDDVQEVLRIGLSEIPQNSRLAEAIEQTIEWCDTNSDWRQTLTRIQEAYGRYHCVHTINNAALVVMGLLHGHGDFGKSVSITVRGGWDTDCTGATCGSILGVMQGACKLPRRWVDPLDDKLETYVIGMNPASFKDLAQRTLRLANEVAHVTT